MMCSPSYRVRAPAELAELGVSSPPTQTKRQISLISEPHDQNTGKESLAARYFTSKSILYYSDGMYACEISTEEVPK
ncbi:unnamed protein product, partial [Oppiella nova]